MASTSPPTFVYAQFGDTSDRLVFDNNEADRFAQDGIIRILVTIFKE